jgi:hypothetical protein
MLVVGDCQRCYANGTNTNNGGRLASGEEGTPIRAKTISLYLSGLSNFFHSRKIF